MAAALEDSRTTEAEVDEEQDFSGEIAKMIRRWKNEKYAPEILPFDQDTIEFFVNLLQFVTENLEEEGEDEKGAVDTATNLRWIEKERFTYILRDYLRIRLRKLSQFPVYYLDKDNQALLSSAERIWLHEYWDNKSQLLQNRFLGALPGHLQSLTNDDNAPMDMVRRPSIQKHVYARICGDLGQLTPSPTPGSVAPTSTQQPLELVEGETYLVQYSVLRKFLMEPDHDGK
ncbi:SLD5, partial [Symbiodinium sp. KB8]